MRFLVLVFMLWPLPLAAQGQLWSFEDRRYYEPLVACVREPHLSLLRNPLGGDSYEDESQARL
jgi:hypothetical protein